MNWTKFVFLMMQYILNTKIWHKELFQIKFKKINLMKLLEIVPMTDIKDH